MATIIPCNQLSKKNLAPFRPLYLQSVRVWEDTWIEELPRVNEMERLNKRMRGTREERN